MAGPLTWKNVDAPNFTGTGALLEGAQSSFSNAIATLQAGAERAAAQRRQRYSASALQGLAGVTDPNEVAAYLGGLNATDLTPEALAVAMKQPEVLLERQKMQLGLQEAQGDLDHKVGTRQGALDAMDNLMAAQAASMQGDVAGALAAQQGITNPYELQAFMGGTQDVLSNATSYQGYRGTEKNYNDAMEAEQRTDRLREQFYNDVLPNANSKEEAIRTFMNSDASAEDKEAFSNMIGAKEDGEFQLIDPTTTTIFEQDPTFNESALQNESTQNWLGSVIENKTNVNPVIRFETTSRNLAEATNEDGSQKTAVEKLQDVFGIEAPGIGWSGMNQQIENLTTAAKAEGLDVTENDIIAAIRENQTTSGIAFNDTLVFDKKGVLDTLKTIKDPKLNRSSMAELESFDRFNDRLTTITEKIESLTAQERVERGKGQTDRAAKSAAAIAKLMEEQAATMEKFMVDNGLADVENSDDSPDPAIGAAVAEPVPGEMNGPGIDLFTAAAAQAEAQRNARQAQLNGRRPVAIPLPLGGVSMEMPAYGDGSFAGPITAPPPQPKARSAIEDILARFAR